jgi:DNA-binding SARP family transcriptional activator/tetratricopeptide (TPR) repeat protein
VNPLCHRYLNQNILPFVGREHEIASLRERFIEFLDEGESKYVLVTGTSGGGKSRLVREFEEYLSQEFADSCVVVHARYLEGNAAALAPVMNAFTATIAQQEHLKRLLQNLRVLKPDHVRLTAREGSELFDSDLPLLQVLLDSLNEIARRFPLVLILEDVHNVEDLPVFDQFFLGLSQAAKFVIFTERRSDVNTAIAESADQLVREIGLREEKTSDVVSLANLRRDDVRRLLLLLFAIEPSNELLDAIEHRTEGHALSLRSVVRQLVTTGVLLYEQGEWYEDLTAIEPVSDAVTNHGDAQALARFQHEVSRLNEHEQIVLVHAAMLGEQFDLRLLKAVIRMRLSADVLPDDLFQRAIDLLTFKSILRPTTPSIYLQSEPINDTKQRDTLNTWCYEFAHQNFWSTAVERTRTEIAGEHELVLKIVETIGREGYGLYSGTFLSITGSPFILQKSEGVLPRVEEFLLWASGVVRELWAIEPQQSLRILLDLRPIRDEVTWRVGPELSQPAMTALLDLHGLLVEAYLRAGSLLEAERDLELAAVLDRFVQSSSSYSRDFKGFSRGRVATLRAVLAASRAAYKDFDRWSAEADDALKELPVDNIDRARLMTILVRYRAEGLLNTGKLREADELIERSIPTAQVLIDSRFDEYCLFYRVAVTSKLKQDENEQATELTSQIINLAQQRGNTLVETTFLIQAALAEFYTGDLRNAIRYCDLGILNGRRYGIRFVEIMSYLWRMIAAGVEQDGEKVKECSQQLSALVEDARVIAQSPHRLQRISMLEGRATAMNFLSRHNAALEYAEEAIQLARTQQHDSFATWAQNEKAMALVGLGRYEEAIEVAKGGVALAGEQRAAARTAHVALLMAYTGLGRFAEAWEQVQLVSTEYKDKNPFYLRYVLAEARLLQLAMKQRVSLIPDLAIQRRVLHSKVKQLIELAAEWKAIPLAESIRREFEDVLPKDDVSSVLLSASRARNGTANSDSTRIRLHMFGTLHAEHVAAAQAEDSMTMLESASEGRTEPRAAEGRGRESKVRQLIAYLAVARAEASEGRTPRRHAGGLSRETLVDALWPDSDVESGTNALYTSVRRARTFLGSAEGIAFSEGLYSLSPVVWTDCEQFLRHYNEARQARKRNALFSITFHYERMLRLSERGAFLDGLYPAWSESLRTRLNTLRRSAALRIVETNLDRGLFDRVDELCQRLLSEDEFDEEALKGLMITAARRRQGTKLFSLYDTFARRLQNELQSEPSPELHSLYEALSSAPDAALDQPVS